jgi:hypothetical protein
MFNCTDRGQCGAGRRAAAAGHGLGTRLHSSPSLNAIAGCLLLAKGSSFWGVRFRLLGCIINRTHSEIEKTRIPRWVLLDSGYTPKHNPRC